jgi:hypothetical protein
MKNDQAAQSIGPVLPLTAAPAVSIRSCREEIDRFAKLHQRRDANLDEKGMYAMPFHIERLPASMGGGLAGWWRSDHAWLRGPDGARASEHPRVHLGACVISSLIVLGLLGVFMLLQ